MSISTEFCYLNPEIVAKVMDFCNFLAQKYNFTFECEHYEIGSPEGILSINLLRYSIRSNILTDDDFTEINKDLVNCNIAIKCNSNMINLYGLNGRLVKYVSNEDISNFEFYKNYCIENPEFFLTIDHDPYDDIVSNYIAIHVIGQKQHSRINPYSILLEYDTIQDDKTYIQYKNEQMQSKLKNLRYLRTLDYIVKQFIIVDDLVELIYEYM